ncbi:MAG: prolyl oligopeptidase family serine peptidase [Calditrichia bacterium]
MKELSLILFVLLILFLHFVSNLVKAQDLSEEATTQQINEWLQLGPFQSMFPAFNEGSVAAKDLLLFDELDVTDWWPSEGETVYLDKSREWKWRKVAAPGSKIKMQGEYGNNPQIIYLAAYLSVARFVKTTVTVSGNHLFRVFLDGNLVKDKTGSDKPGENGETKPGKITETLKLETGTHLLLIKMLKDPENASPWEIGASLKTMGEYGEIPLTIGLSPRQRMDIHRLLDGIKVKGVSISPDGRLITISYSRSLPPSDKKESWLEIRRTDDNSLVQTLRGGMNVSGVKWARQAGVFAYTKNADKKTSVWIVDLNKGTNRPVLKGIENFDTYTWSPDGAFLIYGVTEKPKEKEKKVKRWLSLNDRWPDWRERTYLYRVNIPGGARQRLTAGKLTTNLNGISPDASKLLIDQSVEDYKKRPYMDNVLSILNLASMQVDTVWQGRWLEKALWSPDGKKLLLLGGPSLFGELGRKVSGDKIPNEFDTQAYLFDLFSKKAECISRDFDPAIDSAVWPRKGGSIYFRTADRLNRSLYRYNLKSKRFEKINTGVESVKNFAVSDNGSMAVYTGSGATVPPKAFKIDLKSNQYELVSDPGERDFENVIFGKVEPWNYTTSTGIEIAGTVYYPPDFDVSRSYPCIIYYYGGVSPITRSFGGRYPKNLFAAQGYVVYTMTPAGAIGFGQEFSAIHSNDWGKIVSDQIIEGTRKFLAAHPFVDSARVGCIGASYGGFMTMLLLTKTDVFSAAISHAGISSISSYWGEGFWGYLYNAYSAPNSFPWNRPDIYVQQSALFHADKIKTPLLLLHGDADTNVPPGESTQLFTALKLLGKETEYVQIPGQNHHILNYNKRIVWQKTIIAWFDKWLKNQPEWWDELYGGNTSGNN